MTSSAVATSHAVNPAERINELGRIILAYSEITDKLQKSHDRLEQTVRTLSEELSEKNRQLERKNRLAALGEMAAGMAHEIRNPLGGIQLYASMLTADLAGLPGPLEWAQKISGGVKRLESLVSSVLQFTREISTHIGPAEIGELVGNAVELAKPQAEAGRVTVSADGPAPLQVRVDFNLVSQAVLNLLLNAIQATPPGGSVDVRWREAPAGKAPRQFCLRVCDSGPGIDPRILDKIFNPFFTTKETGTGLGLSIVHRIVDAHDGTVTASNRAGGGAQFEMEI